MQLTEIAEDVWGAEGTVKPGPGMRMRTRMTVIRKPNGGVLVHSPIELSDELAAEIESMGTVEEIVSPNLFHHLFLRGALDRFPNAEFYASEGLAKKRQDLPSATSLVPQQNWLGCLDVFALGGMPRFQEFVFLHRPSKTLIVTDLIFNEPVGETASTRLFFRIFGTYGRLAVSRLFRGVIQDKKAFGASLEPIVSLECERVVMAHGKILESDAQQRFASVMQPFAL
ncbi:MAG: DUF4336 domain-containing protein [Acidobacteriota bacterium]